MSDTDARGELRTELEGYRRDHARLAEQVAGLERESRQLSARFVDSERAHSEMLRMYIAYRRLGDSADGPESLTALQDILSAVIGCEEFVIYGYDAATRTCRLAAALGVDPALHREVPVRDGYLFDAVSGGSTWMAEPLPPAVEDEIPSDPIACVPLKANGTVLGVAAVYGLLSQKLDWEPSDRALFQVLEFQGGKAFYQRRSASPGWFREGR